MSAPTQILEQDQPWQAGPPHTLSVLEVNLDGYKYWGWYGPPNMTGGPCGIVRSNDLLQWDQHPSNPVLASGRWPSVIKIGETFYMAVTKYNVATSTEYIQLLSSPDGVAWSVVETIVPENIGHYTDNPYFFIDPNDGLIYLYYVSVNLSTGASTIFVRCSATVDALDSADPIIIIATPSLIAPLNIASPSMLYFDGVYYLCIETTLPNGKWGTLAYSSNNPTGGFVQLWNSPILSNDEACFFQFKFGSVVCCPTARQQENEAWVLDMRTIDLTATIPLG